ncbi:hypothetical protein ABK040_015993 [Willaertia magna]
MHSASSISSSSASNNRMSNESKRTIFVSNISPQLTNDKLRQFFSYCGEIESMEELSSEMTKYKIIFVDEIGAQKAAKLNGTPMLGFKLNIVGATSELQNASLSAAVEESQQASSKSAEILMDASKESSNKLLNPFIQQIGDSNVDANLVYSTGDVEKDKEIARTVYIGNIDQRVTPSDLVDLFSICGPISYIKMAGDDKHPCRFAFIEFLEIEAANKAMQMTGELLVDKAIKVNRSRKAIPRPPTKLLPNEEKKLSNEIQRLVDKIKDFEEGKLTTGDNDRKPSSYDSKYHNSKYDDYNSSHRSSSRSHSHSSRRDDRYYDDYYKDDYYYRDREGSSSSSSRYDYHNNDRDNRDRSYYRKY